MGSEIIPSDEKLLEVYMWGFEDELNGCSCNSAINIYLRRAYARGMADAIIGDDIRSSDYQSKEDILKGIKNNL